MKHYSRAQTFLLLSALLCLALPQIAHADYLGGITIDKVSPSFIPHGEHINVTVDYKVDEPEGAIVFVRPFTMGAPTPGYGAQGGHVVAAGTGTTDHYFFIGIGEQVITHVRVYLTSLDQSMTYLEIFVPVHYVCGPNGVFNVQTDHNEYDRLPFGKHLNINFDYGVDTAENVRIRARPFTDGALTPGYLASSSGSIPPSGSYSQYFYFNYDADVTDIRFQIFTEDSSTMLDEFFIPFEIYWRETGLYDISIDWPNGEYLHNSQNLVATFTLEHSAPENRYAWVQCSTGGNYTPGSSYQGSAPVPAGPQTITRYCRVVTGEHDVDGIRFIYGLPQEVMMQFIVPVQYHYASHAIQNHVFSPAAPAIMSNGERLNVNFDYLTDETDGVLIYSRPAYDGGLLYGISSAGSPLHPAPMGSGSFWLTFNSGEHLASSMYMVMRNNDQSVDLFEQFIDGWWAWGSSGQITPAPELLPTVSAELGGAFPNPFNPTTSIPVVLAKDTQVQLRVYDIRGRLVETLQDGELTAGRHVFTFRGESRPSGIYYCRMKTPSGVVSRPMALVK